MFAFHKPKVYRSSTGCCICKAKSSSSRFTDSKKYEDDFMECFLLEERRTGEICNACVLLVKRWKKLPPDNVRNWRHVVDARAGPGIKSLTKFKSKNKKKLKDGVEKAEKVPVKRKHVYRKREQEREQSPATSDELNEDYGARAKEASRTSSPDEFNDMGATEKRLTGIMRQSQLSVYDFIDMTYFKRETICCGEIFRGMYGEVIINPELFKRCAGCTLRRPQHRQVQINQTNNNSCHTSASASPAHSTASSSSPAHSPDSTTDNAAAKTTGKLFSDCSSDSGYDESSNQGIGENKMIKSNINGSNRIVDIKNYPVKTVKLVATPVSETVRLQAEHQMTIPANSLIDFAMHAAARQSVMN